MISRTHTDETELQEKVPFSPPLSWKRSLLIGVKAIHSVLYFSIEWCMGYLIYAGIKQQEDKKTAIAAGVVTGECIIFLGNRARCPLTAVAKNLGDPNGSVTDIYLPHWLAANLVWIHIPLVALALYLHIRNFSRLKKLEMRGFRGA